MNEITLAVVSPKFSLKSFKLEVQTIHPVSQPVDSSNANLEIWAI